MNNRLLVLWIFFQQCFSQHLGKEECASGCKSCFHGHCLTCRSSYYGLDCTSRCNDRCIQDGSCQGESCLNGCPFQRYGSGCTRKCLNCARGCRKNGVCKNSPKPKTDYNDDFSRTKKSNKKLGAVLKAVAATVSITVITCVITACCRRKKDISDPDSDDFQDVVVDSYQSSSDDSSLIATRNLGRETGYSSPTRSPIEEPDYSSVAASSEESNRRTSGHRLQPRSQVVGPENQSVVASSGESNRRVPSPTQHLSHSGLEGPDYSSDASSVQEAQERRRANRHGLSSLDTTSVTPSGDVINSSGSSGPPTAPPSPPPPPSYSSPPPAYSGNSGAPPPSYSALFPDRVQR